MSTALQQISVARKDWIEEAIRDQLVRQVRQVRLHSRQPIILRGRNQFSFVQKVNDVP